MKNEPVAVHRLPGMAVHLCGDVPLEGILGALSAEGTLLKRSHKSETRRVGDWVVKAGVPDGGFSVLKRTFMRGRYRRAWNAALHKRIL